MLLHPVRRYYEDSGWTDEDSDSERRSSDMMQRRILQPERFRVTVALTVLGVHLFICTIIFLVIQHMLQVGESLLCGCSFQHGSLLGLVFLNAHSQVICL